MRASANKKKRAAQPTLPSPSPQRPSRVHSEVKAKALALGETLEGFRTWSLPQALILGSMSQRGHPNLLSDQLRTARPACSPARPPASSSPRKTNTRLLRPPLLCSLGAVCPTDTGDGQTTDLQTNPGLLGILTAAASSLHLSHLCLHQRDGRTSRAKMNGFSVIRVYCVPSPNSMSKHIL